MHPGTRFPSPKELLVQKRGPWSRRSIDPQQGQSGFVPLKPRIAQHDFMFFGLTRPQTWPGTKGGGSRFHQRPSAGRAGRRGGKRKRAVTASASIRSVGDLSKHRIYIEDVYPVVDGGRFPVKRIVGEDVDVWADIFRDGHVVLAAELLWRREGTDKWLRVPMVPHDNVRWAA